ncbi:MAG TPA: glutamate--cysteine ligase [Verrucomicrobiales bacterium]|nr:glutamate--cysteine ligase [Verrucomicrobiales bacterium]
MKKPFGLFQRFGVELEYMIVDAETLAVRAEADRLIKAESGELDGDVSRGALEWSNELALHVIELKTGRPAAKLTGLAEGFQDEVKYINSVLSKSGARLLPTAMHPWMNPATDSRLWPHSNAEIYAAFDRIFNCSGHGWSNLQSVHLNLPFRTPAEFRRLHAAIRVLLPLLPALAASSPFVEGRRAPLLDMRLETYRHNCRRIPSITGNVIPEPVKSPADYRRDILKPIYRDLAPHDPEGILQEEWANARGAIARFERSTIEIRVLDIQECPAADLAIIQFIVAILRALVSGGLSSEERQHRVSTLSLESLLLNCAEETGRTWVADANIRRAVGIDSRSGMTVGDVLRKLLDAVAADKPDWRPIIEVILEEGTLSERIVKTVGLTRPKRDVLHGVYNRLADCLHRGEQFHP